MKIDIWSDIACPFCYIGKRNLEIALKEMEAIDDIEIIYHSFQLDPNAKKGSGTNSAEQLADKYGTSIGEAQNMIDRVISMAKSVGLEFNYNSVINTNTYDAHRFIHLSKKYNKDKEATEELFKAYFIDGLDIGDVDVLVKIGAGIGLDTEEVSEVLNSDEYSAEVDIDKYTAAQYQITSVPFFIFNNKYAISGAQPPAAFIETMKKANE